MYRADVRKFCLDIAKYRPDFAMLGLDLPMYRADVRKFCPDFAKYRPEFAMSGLDSPMYRPEFAMSGFDFGRCPFDIAQYRSVIPLCDGAPFAAS
jgi:hypothetical protein